MIHEHNLNSSCVAMDVGGLGKGVVDRLWEQQYKVQAINFGESAGQTDDTPSNTPVEADPRKAFKNRRSEMYGALRERLQPEYTGPNNDEEPFLLPPNAHELRGELAILPLEYDSEGKLVLPPKSQTPTNRTSTRVSIRSLLGRSPDRADALVLALHALRKGRTKKPQEPWGGVIPISSGRPSWFRPSTSRHGPVQW